MKLYRLAHKPCLVNYGINHGPFAFTMCAYGGGFGPDFGNVGVVPQRDYPNHIVERNERIGLLIPQFKWWESLQGDWQFDDDWSFAEFEVPDQYVHVLTHQSVFRDDKAKLLRFVPLDEIRRMVVAANGSF